MRLAAGLRPDPLRELKVPPGPLAAIRGLLLRGGERRGRGGEGRGKGREKGKGGGTCSKVLGGIDAPGHTIES